MHFLFTEQHFPSCTNYVYSTHVKTDSPPSSQLLQAKDLISVAICSQKIRHINFGHINSRNIPWGRLSNISTRPKISKASNIVAKGTLVTNFIKYLRSQ